MIKAKKRPRTSYVDGVKNGIVIEKRRDGFRLSLTSGHSVVLSADACRRLAERIAP
jgi:hypothetical protein